MNAPQQWLTWNELALTGTVWPSAVIAGEQRFSDGPLLQVCSPVDGRTLGQFHAADPDLVEQALASASVAQQQWQQVPAPRRAELIRAIAERVRSQRQQLAELITLEVGKIPAEAAGEVQEWLDMCDFALGLSRQLHGLTIASERSDHRMMEQWHPLGVVGVISAFNFPMAVWAWNAMLALVCGNAVVWKPSEKTPLCALAAAQIVDSALHQVGAPLGLNHLLLGEARCGRWLAADHRIALLSATGSVRMGRSVAQTVAARLGRSLLELGGNNAMIVSDSADLDLALRAIVFSAVGTCGQRCTTLRRLIVHEKIAERLLRRLQAAYRSLPIGDPHQPGVLVGPLIDAAAWHAMQAAIARAVADGGERLWGGQRLRRGVPAGGYYVRPALVRVPGNLPAVREETFAPILYVMTYRDFDQAIALQNAVSQGLSSAVFTTRIGEAERFMSAAGSDCGIANVNIGTSGAEIGGAFGGEKDTGGGRESGSDAWKNYMRRVTNTVNYGHTLPLAQGICFETKKAGQG